MTIDSFAELFAIAVQAAFKKAKWIVLP